jgi:hypothetical protein
VFWTQLAMRRNTYSVLRPVCDVWQRLRQLRGSRCWSVLWPQGATLLLPAQSARQNRFERETCSLLVALVQVAIRRIFHDKERALHPPWMNHRGFRARSQGNNRSTKQYLDYQFSMRYTSGIPVLIHQCMPCYELKIISAWGQIVKCSRAPVRGCPRFHRT